MPNPARTHPTILLTLLFATLGHTAMLGGRVAISLFGLELGASLFVVGVLQTCFAVLPAIFAIPAGKIIDRFGCRLPMQLALCGVSLGTALPFLFPTLPVLFGAIAISGTGNALYFLAQQQLTLRLTTPARRTADLSLSAMAYSVSGMLGPVLAGLAIDHGGFRNTFAILALPPLLALVALLIVAPAFPPAGNTPARSGPRQRTLELLHDPRARAVHLVGALLSLAWDLHNFIIPLYGASLGLSATSIGLLLGSFGLATFFVRFILPALARRNSSWTLMQCGLAAIAASFAAYPFATWVSQLAALSFLAGVATGMTQPLTASLLQDLTPPSRLGEALGLRYAIVNTIHVLVPLLAGATAGGAGIAVAFWGLAAMEAGGLSYAMLRRKLIEPQGDSPGVKLPP